MPTLKLILEEIRYRKLNFLLSLLAVVVTATLFVAAPMLVDAYGEQTIADLKKDEDQTRKNMIKMGFNLLVLHRDTDLSDYWAEDFAGQDMPQDYVDRLAESKLLKNVRHIVATLAAKTDFGDRKAILLGYLPEVTQKHFGSKKPMGYNVKPGTAVLGFALRNKADDQGEYQPGDTITVEGTPLEIARIEDEKGNKDDVTIVVNLSDAQQMLGKPDMVNQILALGCHCRMEDAAIIREQLTSVLPDSQVIVLADVLEARAIQRKLQADRVATSQRQWSDLVMVALPAVVLACAVFVGLFTLANVRDRRTEIGLLRALGKGSARIAAMFIGKALMVGLIGGAIGFGLGTLLALGVGNRVLAISDEYLRVNLGLLLGAIVGTPLVCALASYLPTLSAVQQDPAVVLRDQ